MSHRPAATRIYNLCHAGCVHNIEPEPPRFGETDARTGRPVKSQERHTWESRRSRKNAEMFVHEFAKLGLAKLVPRPGRSDQIVEFEPNYDDARLPSTRGRLIIPSAATCEKLGKPDKNFIIVDDPELAVALLSDGKRLWCLVPEDVLLDDLTTDVESVRVKMEREKQAIFAENAEARAEGRRIRIRGLRDAGYTIRADVNDADLDLIWEGHKSGRASPQGVGSLGNTPPPAVGPATASVEPPAPPAGTSEPGDRRRRQVRTPADVTPPAAAAPVPAPVTDGRGREGAFRPPSGPVY